MYAEFFYQKETVDRNCKPNLLVYEKGTPTYFEMGFSGRLFHFFLVHKSKLYAAFSRKFLGTMFGHD